ATFADGTFIRGTLRPFRHLVGARLERVEGRALAVLYEGLKPYVAFSQEGHYRNVFDDSFPGWPLLMAAAGLVEIRNQWSLEGTLANGQHFHERLPLLNRR